MLGALKKGSTCRRGARKAHVNVSKYRRCAPHTRRGKKPRSCNVKNLVSVSGYKNARRCTSY